MTDLAPIERLTVTNFRGVRSVVLDLAPRVTVLFGNTASGKSTLLDALSIAL